MFQCLPWIWKKDDTVQFKMKVVNSELCSAKSLWKITFFFLMHIKNFLGFFLSTRKKWMKKRKIPTVRVRIFTQAIAMDHPNGCVNASNESSCSDRRSERVYNELLWHLNLEAVRRKTVCCIFFRLFDSLDFSCKHFDLTGKLFSV